MELADNLKRDSIPSEHLSSVAKEFVQKVKEDYKYEFLIALEEYRKQVGDFPKSIEKWLINKNMIEPGMLILQGKEANKELVKMGFSVELQQVREDEMLVVYKPPKPFLEFRKKYKKEIVEHDYFNEPKQIQELEGAVIEWGWFVRRLRKVVWKRVYEIEQKYEDEIKITRGNKVGDHSKDFYYVLLMQED